MTDVLNIGKAVNENRYLTYIDDIRVTDVKMTWNKCRRRFFRNPTSNIFFCIYGVFRTTTIKSIKLNYGNFQKYAFSSEIPVLAQIAICGQVASIPEPAKVYRRHDLSEYNKEQLIICCAQVNK